MEMLPPVRDDLAGCELDADGLAIQFERYRRAGEGAELVERTPRGFVLRLRPGVDADEVGEAVATERACCPFYEIAWDPGSRELTFAVHATEHEPALDAIAFALGLSE